MVLAIHVSFGGAVIAASELLQSERLRAMALDQHVNRPGQTPEALNRCALALHDPTEIIGMPSSATSDMHDLLGGDWYETGRILGFTGTWYVELHDTLFNARLQAKRKATKNKAATLSHDELDAIDAALRPEVEQLVLLRIRCSDPAAAADPPFDGLVTDLGLDVQAAALTRSNTADVTTLGATLETMSQGQLDALAELYRFRRNEFGTMTDSELRWAAIVAGGYAGALGNLLTAPKIFTL